MVDATWSGSDEFFAAFLKIQADVDSATTAIVNAGSLMLISASMNNFSGSHAAGEPHEGGSQPNIVTGDLRRSIAADPITRLGLASYSTVVAPRMAYGRRVEMGFSGSDSLGRNYDSSAYPYFGPAVNSIAPQFAQTAAKLWGNAFNR